MMDRKATKLWRILRHQTSQWYACASCDVNSIDRYSNRTQYCTVTPNTATPSTETTAAVKPFSEVPCKKYKFPLEMLWDTYKSRDSSHLALQEAYKTYEGRIFKVSIFNTITFLYLGNVDDVRKLHGYDGRMPQRMILPAWSEWREKSGFTHGILISSGEEWKRMRTQLDKQMLRPASVSSYTQDFNEVNEDFIQHIRNKRCLHEHTMTGLDQELFRWSLEGTIKMLYDTRLHSFGHGERDAEIERFIGSVHRIFRATFTTVMPGYLRKTLFRKYQKLNDDGWDCVFTTGKKMIDNKLGEIQRDLDNGLEVKGFLASLLTNDKLNVSDIYANVSELMLAAVDTTSNTMQWILYYLTTHPTTLQLLQEEIRSLLPRGVTPTHEHVAKMPYLRAVVKETLRLVPPAGSVTRTTTEDVELGGYHIPKGINVICMVYQMCRDPAYFPDPDNFLPERWLREDKQPLHTFASLPFGHGPRMCIGKRVAELEMHLLLARLVQEFDMAAGDKEERHIVSIGLLVPHKSVNIRFRDNITPEVN